MTGLQKSSKGYVGVEDMLTVEDSCWRLLDMLRVLKVYRPPGDEPHLDAGHPAYSYTRDLVSYWYQLYMERKGS